MKRVLSLLLAVVLIIGSLLTLSSCDIFMAEFGKEFGNAMDFIFTSENRDIYENENGEVIEFDGTQIKGSYYSYDRSQPITLISNYELIDSATNTYRLSFVSVEYTGTNAKDREYADSLNALIAKGEASTNEITILKAENYVEMAGVRYYKRSYIESLAAVPPSGTYRAEDGTVVKIEGNSLTYNRFYDGIVWVDSTFTVKPAPKDETSTVICLAVTSMRYEGTNETINADIVRLNAQCASSRYVDSIRAFGFSFGDGYIVFDGKTYTKQ